MKTLALCIGFYSLGIFNCAVFVAVYMLHRPRYVAPTKRRNRDRLPEVRNVPPMPVCKPARVDEVGVNYQWINLTGLEDK